MRSAFLFSTRFAALVRFVALVRVGASARRVALVRRAVAVVAVAVVVLGVLAAAPLETSAQSDATIVYLVRHAERAEDGTNDPPISDLGRARSELLADMLRDTRITHIHTTDYRRTRETGASVARDAGLEMEVYDPRDLGAFAARLRGMPGRHLVLGHSNTTPELVEALGGDAGSEIAEMEYDRLYIVTLTPGGATTVLLRFGERFEG